jgi:hypothetical protein
MNTGNVKVTGLDTATLPADLLTTAKTHLRVEFNRDDAYITQALQRAINLYEQFTGRSAFVRNVQWQPVPFPPLQPAPFQPVTDLVATDPAGGDVTNQYQVLDRGGAVYIATIDGVTTFGDGVSFGYKTGFATAAEMPLGALDIVLRITAGLYETREHQTFVTMEMVSFWLQDLIVGAGWIPRA